jgi:ATP-binding cassette subfamily B protein
MTTSNIRWFELFFFKKGRLLVLLSFVCLIIAAILGGILPIRIKNLAALYDDKEKYFSEIFVLASIFLGVYFNRVVYQLSINKYVKFLMQKARSECFGRWLHVYDLHTGDADHRDEYPQGEVMARIINDTEAIRELMTSGSFGILIDLFFVISCLISFITINQTSGLFLGGVEIIAAGFLIWGSRHMRDIFLLVRQSRGRMSRTLANLVGGIRDTFYTKHDHYAVKKGTIDFDDFLNKILYSNVWDAGYYSIAESLYPILLALVVFIFPYSEITQAAVIFAIVDLIQRSIGPIKDISAKIANIQRAWSGIIRIQEFLGDLAKGHSTFNQVIDVELAEVESLTVKINSFEYPSRKSDVDKAFKLDKIQFEAKNGQLIGLVGTSGSGKSTVFNIIAGNIVVKDGSVIAQLKDQKKRSFPGAGAEDIISYRQLVGLVSQESHLFSETIAFNLTLKEKPDDSFYQFWSWVETQIPYIKTWGIKPEDKIDIKSISLGQRQLLAAIRACYLKKPIVLFDEISSGLDSELELALRKMVLLIQQKALTMIVAHRLETVLDSDLLLIMEEGKLVDAGRHQDLEKESTAYQKFLQEISHSNSL